MVSGAAKDVPLFDINHHVRTCGKHGLVRLRGYGQNYNQTVSPTALSLTALIVMSDYYVNQRRPMGLTDARVPTVRSLTACTLLARFATESCLFGAPSTPVAFDVQAIVWQLFAHAGRDEKKSLNKKSPDFQGSGATSRRRWRINKPVRYIYPLYESSLSGTRYRSV